MKKTGCLLLGAGLFASCSHRIISSEHCAPVPQPEPQPYLVRYYGPVECQPGRQYARVDFDITTEGVFAGLFSDTGDYKDLHLSGKERPGPCRCFAPDRTAAESSPMTLDLRVRSVVTYATTLPVLIRIPMAQGVGTVLVEPVPGG
jgi:hypothetical protein